MSNSEPGDTSFGRAALAKQEKADKLVSQGANPIDAPEGDGIDPRPRAGGKASEGAPPAAEVEEAESSDEEKMPTIMDVALSEAGIATQTPTPM